MSYNKHSIKKVLMTDNELLSLYDTIAEEIDDEILDEADELFGVDGEEEPSDEYFIWCAKTHLARAS